MVHVRIGTEEIGLTWDEWEQRVESGRIPPDALVRFDAVTGGDWVAAADLEMYRSIADSRASAFARHAVRSAPPVLTALLVGVQVRIWWLARFPEIRAVVEQTLTKWTAPTLEDGEVWRVLTMGFVHVQFTHALMNLVWLAYTSFHLERTLGWRNTLWIYLGSVAGGSLLSMVGAPDVPSIGASGGVFGLIAALVVFGFTRPELLHVRNRGAFGFALLPYLVLMFLSGVLNAGTDNWSHFGGLLTGGALALVADPPGFERRAGWNRRWILGTTATLALALAVLGLAGPRLTSLRSDEEARAVRMRLRSGKTVPRLADLNPSPLAYTVPIGWVQGRALTGETGWTSPLSDRTWAVTADDARQPQSPDELAQAWLAEVEDLGLDTTLVTVDSVTFLGQPAVRRVVRVQDEETWELTWMGIVRGNLALTVLWQVEADRARRLAPLADRLLAGVTWDDPPELVEARGDVERAPGSVDGRRRLAEQLARVGRPEEALALQHDLVRATPTSRTDQLALLQTLDWYPDLEGTSVDEDLQNALGAGLGPRVDLSVVEVLLSAERPGEADALLDILWALAPGERTIARMRARRGLSNALEPGSGTPALLGPSCPWAEALRHASEQALARGHVTLDDAQAVATIRDAARARLAAAVASAEGPALQEALVRLALGHAAVDVQEEIAALRIALEGDKDPPPWWHEALPPRADLQAALAAGDADD